MAQKTIPQDVQLRVLLRSRRRSCICYGLNNVLGQKSGQLAHLDQDPSNNSDENLAFICLSHHDWYDGTTSQSKHITISEAKHFRQELDQALRSMFERTVFVGPSKSGAIGMIQALPVHHYIRIKHQPAEITLTPIGNNRFKVEGEALWGTDREFGPNIGILKFEAELAADALEHAEGEYRVLIKLVGGGLEVTEDNWIGVHGMNVTFAGRYERAS